MKSLSLAMLLGIPNTLWRDETDLFVLSVPAVIVSETEDRVGAMVRGHETAIVLARGQIGQIIPVDSSRLRDGITSPLYHLDSWYRSPGALKAAVRGLYRLRLLPAPESEETDIAHDQQVG